MTQPSPFNTTTARLAREATTDLYRLTPEVYAKLERQCVPPAVVSGTSPIEAGYKLGVQAVLKLLREGFSL